MKNIKLAYLLLVAILATSSCKTQNSLINYDKKLLKKGFSGVILIADNDSIIFNKAYGKKNSQKNSNNTLNTIFDICSLTKQFTGAAILKLSMKNKISLNDNITKYFEAVPDDKKNITIHHLLTHTSGLVGVVGYDYETITEEEFLDKVFKTKLISPIGEEHNYSNIGYSLLALIIEKTSGMGYEKFLNAELFKPVKMNHTGYIIPNWNTNDISNGFRDGIERKKPNEFNWSESGPYLNLKGNGGILSRAGDLLLWSNAIRDHKILDKTLTSKYLYPHIIEYKNAKSYYGYGWIIENNEKEDKLVWHDGGNGIYASNMWMYPKKGVTIIVLSNKDEDVHNITRKLSNIVFKN